MSYFLQSYDIFWVLTGLWLFMEKQMNLMKHLSPKLIVFTSLNLFVASYVLISVKIILRFIDGNFNFFLN